MGREGEKQENGGSCTLPTSLYCTLLSYTVHHRGGAGCCGGGDDSQGEARSSGAMASGSLRLASSGPQHIVVWG